MAAENQNPNLASSRQSPIAVRRQTPVSQRRPLHRINLNASVLSPTKRRKQSHVEETSAADPVKPGNIREVVVPTPDRERPAFGRWSDASGRETGSLLLEVFSRLHVRELIGNAAPACKLWHDVAHNKELWTVMQSQLRLVDQLLVMEKVVERRSKGRLFRCKQLGTGNPVLLRMVDLELTNAGKDDGVPTSFLREAALLKRLEHPNIIRHFGSEILGKKAVMCTEFVHESFTHWFKRLELRSPADKVFEIKGNFRQLLTGLSHIHHQGVMHRNLKPDNIFIDERGCVKLGDFTTTRMLDFPFQAYTPEDPKERDRSGREMRRLWYRAPELILRDDIYGPKVDTWSLGCLLAEAASGRPLFQSDSEIDHLFRVFRLTGTPNAITWPEVVTMKNFSPKFPLYAGFNLAQVTRAATSRNRADQTQLMMQAQPDREDILRNLLSVANILGAEGMFALDQLVALPPAIRAGADATLASPFFGGGGAVGVEGDLHPAVIKWLAGCSAPSDGPAAGAVVAAPAADFSAVAAAPAPEQQSAMASRGALFGPSGSETRECPPVSVPSSLMPADMAWSILATMQRHERHDGVSGGRWRAPPQLPPGFDATQRTVLMDLVIGLANQLTLTDYTLHLAGRVIDGYLAQQDKPVTPDRLQVIGATCLKIADVFAEQSKEYYKQENAVEYAEAALNLSEPFHTTSEQMLACEKDVLPALNFDLHMPTAQWFVQCYMAYARFTSNGRVAKTASFIGDLVLLDYSLLQYPPSLRAQCIMLLAVFLVQQAKQHACRLARPAAPRPPATPAATAPPPPPSAAAVVSAAAEPLEAPPCGPVASDVAHGNVPPAAVAVAPSEPMALPSSSSSGSSSTGSGSGGVGDKDATSATFVGHLTCLEHWDRHVRDQACKGNLDVDAEMCLQAMVRTLTTMRREWKGMKLTQVETKHGNLARTIVYPEKFPVSELVRHILPSYRHRGKRLISEASAS